MQGYSDTGRDQQDYRFHGRENDQSPGNVVAENVDHGVCLLFACCLRLVLVFVGVYLCLIGGQCFMIL
jgi:hypothetical protein